ncbi:uncharacterized protein [Venturia canescens]|uniref:uncharacterized protein n=1 Tax=Venturia canescens TaxID=32260 RepID=UPI001C9C9D82|nr:uncharacterized protein LOC122416928 [Venturia canescens]
MTLVKYLALAAFLAINLCEIEAHGRLMDPVNRSSAWRRGFNVSTNFNDAGNYCGGFGVQYNKQNKGRCGVCGDDFSLPQPRANENGGKFGKGIIVKTYRARSKIKVDVELTANHKGYYEFALCPLKDKKQLETEECFDMYKLKLVNGGYQYKVTAGKLGHEYIPLQLPAGLTCNHCVLRWQYTAGNNWGICPDGKGRVGCGPQETFRTCSDIEIQ